MVGYVVDYTTIRSKNKNIMNTLQLSKRLPYHTNLPATADKKLSVFTVPAGNYSLKLTGSR